MTDIPGVLLAGGLARRMGGGDKPMMPALTERESEVLKLTALGFTNKETARRLDIDGADTQFFHQFAWPGLATLPMLPATSVPIGHDADGLPIGVQVIADLYADHHAIAVARIAHDLVRSRP